MQGKSEIRYTIISTDNPVSIKIPVDVNGAPLGTRGKKLLEVTDFHWAGTFSKVATGTGSSTDVHNVPPNFFYFSADESIVDNAYSKDASVSKIVDYAYPKTQLDSIPTTSPLQNRVGGNTIDDYGGISYDFVKIVYTIEENTIENIDIGNMLGSEIKLFIYSNLNYIDGSNNTQTKNNLFSFVNRPIQGLNNVSEPYVLRVTIYDIPF